ncbi:hypothetical protein JMJ77_0013649 [Colletotrichum scovillei]|uniref:Uncharacterized protein n=1 Tax=Colletotrichum scovillei TaxID=1209932 RepID=A0A9P7QQC9_9PEZI|nr:hypothetical protein JMJ78_0012938 [Colletotrichum scovillei]KAG7040652.1 hypothetical protein JMJ77_0013649 [Colletotrichum scovillei]KAG7060699.1 hypothetical protein JMJ76_0006242 [Colletotrichum scovillei]
MAVCTLRLTVPDGDLSAILSLLRASDTIIILDLSKNQAANAFFLKLDCIYLHMAIGIDLKRNFAGRVLVQKER